MSILHKHMKTSEQVVHEAKFHWFFNILSLGMLNLFSEQLVTNQCVLCKRGIIAVSVRSLPLSRIEERELNMSIVGRMFNFGDIVLHGTGGQIERFETLHRPDAFLRAIDEASMTDK